MGRAPCTSELINHHQPAAGAREQHRARGRPPGASTAARRAAAEPAERRTQEAGIRPSLAAARGHCSTRVAGTSARLRPAAEARGMAFLLVALALAPAAANAAWVRCPSGVTFSNADCRDILNTPPGSTLAQCEAKCSTTKGCTAFNIGGGGCALRACTVGTEPTRAMHGFIGWADYPLKCPPMPLPPPPAPRRPPPPPPPPVVYGFRWATTHSDGMVLQAAPQHSIVWGFAEPTTTAVRVCLGDGACVDAVLEPGPPNSTGAQIFTATLPQMPPNAAPHSVTATATATSAATAAASIVLHDVVFGDVYVCSGQSNMDFAAPMAFNATTEDYDYPDIRLYTVQKCHGGGPHTCIRRGPAPTNENRATWPGLEFLNASFSGQTWVPANKTTVYGATPWTGDDYKGWEAKIGQVVGGKGFSGACWYFGKELYKRRKYPIGLIWSSIGGTPDEIWMPPAAFTACGQMPRVGDGWDLMTAPLLKNVIAGAIWYQGESNEAAPLSYNCTFPALIDAWRAEWYNATNVSYFRLCSPIFVCQRGWYPLMLCPQLRRVNLTLR